MRFLIFLILFFTNYSIGQDKYPKDYFRSPLDIPLSLAGSFGELRPNHFHSGIDFRTQQKEGLPVYASADGYISRIKISTVGYGKSIYIDHPNGYTTVYGHLQRCAPEIQNILNKEHYAKQNYEIEIRPKVNEMPVKKGDLIAYSGNTGGSSGPHLHYEIRDTKSEFIINPLYFGLCDSLKDTRKPVLNSILAYPLDTNSQINGSSNPVFLNLNLQKDGSYIANTITASGKIGFGVNAYDLANNSYGKNGIFKISSFANGLPYFGYEFETFSFDETKLINTFIDYARYKEQKQRFQKLFVGYFYPQNIIKTRKNDGILNVSSNLTTNYKIILEDFNQNKTEVNIPVTYGVLPITQQKSEKITPYFLKALNEQSYTKDDISVFIPEKTFYEDFYLDFDVKNNELFLHNDSVAVNGNMTISFDVSNIPVPEREKMFIANLDGSRTEYNNTYKKENLFTIYTKKLGKFFLFKDEEAPKIYNPSFKDEDVLDEAKSFKIYISDNLSGIKEYSAFLNGKWILMEYETKLNRLTHNFSDDIFINGRNDFKLIVKDNMGNSTTFESYFTKTK